MPGEGRWPGKATLVDGRAQGARRSGATDPGKRSPTDGTRPASPADEGVRLYDVYVDIYRRDLARTVVEHLAQTHWPDPAPDMPWARGGDRQFARGVAGELRSRIAGSAGHQLSALLYPGNPRDAFRRHVGTTRERLQHAGWSAEFGDAFARLVERAVWTSLQTRMGPRYRAALGQMFRFPRAEELIPGHPIDPLVATALTQPGILDTLEVAAEKDLGPPRLKAVTAVWLGKRAPELWNFVEVRPSSATVEDVAAALWKDSSRTTYAYALTKVGDMVRVAPEHARVLLRSRYPGEVMGDSDQDTSRARQIYALATSKAVAPSSRGTTRPAGKANTSEPTPTLADVMKIEHAIRGLLQSIHGQAGLVGLTRELSPGRGALDSREHELATGDPAVLHRWLPTLQFQHSQLITIEPRIPPLVQALQALVLIPDPYLDDARRARRDRLRTQVTDYVRAAAVSHDRAASMAILTGVIERDTRQAVDALDDAQISTRQAIRQGTGTTQGAPRDAVGAEAQLARAREAALGGKRGAQAPYDEKKALIRAGEVSLRSRMRAVEQALDQLRAAADQAGFADPAVLRKLLPNVKPLPEVLADVHGHLQDVDHTWQQTRSEFTPEVLPSDAPDDWGDWQERAAGLEAARGAFVRIAGDRDIGTFLNEARTKIKDQQMWNAITKVAAALLISMVTGMGAAALGDMVAGALVTEASGLAAQLTATGVNIAVNASINSVVQLALAEDGTGPSFGMAMLENTLMELFTRGLTKPLKNAEQLAAREVQLLAHLPGLTAIEREVLATAPSFAGAHLLVESVGGMTTQWAAHRILQIAGARKEEVAEPFAMTVLQQGAALGVGRFFAGRLAAWQQHRNKLGPTRFGRLPEMRALHADREAFYARAKALASDLSPDPAAGHALAARDASLLARERSVLEGAATDSAVRAPEGPQVTRNPAPPHPDEAGHAPPRAGEATGAHFDHRERYTDARRAEFEAKLGKKIHKDLTIGDGVALDVQRTKARFFGYDYVVTGVRVGTEARAADVLAHATQIKLVERYNGALGAVRKAIDAFRRPDGGRLGAGQYPHGSRGWVLAAEIDKLQTHIENTHLERARGEIDAALATQEIAHLEGAAAYFRAELGTVGRQGFDAQFELARPGTGQSTEAALAAGYKLPGEPGGEVAGGVHVDPSWYYYSRSARDPAVFELARKPGAPPEAPQLQVRVAGGKFAGIGAPERPQAPLLTSIHGEDKLYALYTPGQSMDQFVTMLERQGFATRPAIDDIARAQFARLANNPKATIDDWRHAVKAEFKPRVLERLADPALDQATSYRLMRDVVDGLANADRGNLVEDWYRARFAPGAKRQGYSVERTSGPTEGTREDRVADLIVGGEIREFKDVDGPIDEGQLDAHLDAVRDDKLSARLGAQKVRYVFTKLKGAVASEAQLMSRFRDERAAQRLVVEVIDAHGRHHQATTAAEARTMFAHLRGVP